MKIIFICGLVIAIFLLACQNASVQTVEPSNVETKKKDEQAKTMGNSKYLKDSLQQPSAIKDCLSKTTIAEPFEFDLEMNPYYIRADFDSNRITDYAAIVIGKKTKKKGLVICKDSKLPFVLGELANSNPPLTDMKNDNFISHSWDIVTKAEATKWNLNAPNDSNKKLLNAKGEILEFIYEIDGILYIYWDGKNFQSVAE